MNDEILNSNIENLEASSLSINIKIRTLDNEFMVNINSENRIEDLKKRIENVSIIYLDFILKISKVPLNRQRLIFRGRLLRDNDLISFYKITDLDVIHLVANTREQEESPNNQEESAMNSESFNTRRRDSSLYNLMNRLIRPGMENSESSIVNLGKQSYKYANII
jgi:hypothetical protein